MIKKSAEEMAFFFVKKGIIDEKEKDVYIYGSELLISEMICTLLVIGIGICTEKFIETLLYLASYMPIRIYAGGYHANTHRSCITIFNICYVILFFIVEILLGLNYIHIIYILAAGATFVIFILAPIEDMRKPLDEKEICVYKKKAQKGVLILYLFAIIVSCAVPELREEICYGMAAVFEIAMLLIIGYIKNKISFRDKNYVILKS